MTIIVNAVLPLFALILLGYAAGRKRLLGPGAVDSLNKFVVWMALPALLFESMAKVGWEAVSQWGYIAATMLAIALCFLAAWLLGRRRPRRLGDASIEALAASYSNAGFMGIPLCLMVFGEAGLPPVILNTLLTACGLFAFSIVLIEFDLQAKAAEHDGGASRPALCRTVSKVVVSLLRNPLVAAPLLGLAVSAMRWPLPYAIEQLTGLLGAAASPCALVTIGLFLSQRRATERRATVWSIVGLKLLLHPLAAYILAYWIFSMPPLWAASAVLLAALPVGTGPFMLAQLYDREPAVASQAILISTVLSLLSVSILVAWLAPAPA